jgi:hypothetical protein
VKKEFISYLPILFFRLLLLNGHNELILCVKLVKSRMGTQFSKIKVTQRVEVHGQVIHNYHPDILSPDIYSGKSR